MVRYNLDMSKHKTDANEKAGQAVHHAITGQEQPLSHDLEAAWTEWSKGIQEADRRTMTLLRAAFEAGWGAGGSVP
jgi:hypothetical protein